MIYTNISTLPNLLAARDTLGLARLVETARENYLKDKGEYSDHSQVYCFYGNDLASKETHLYIADYNMNILNVYALDCGETEFGISNLYTTYVEDIALVLKQTISIKEISLSRVKNLFAWLSNNTLNIFILPNIEVVDDSVEKASLFVSYQDFIISDVEDKKVENMKNMTTLLVTREDTASIILSKIIKNTDYLTYYIEPSKDKVLAGLTVTIGYHPDDQLSKDLNHPLEYVIAIRKSFTQNVYASTQGINISGEKEDNHHLRCAVFEEDSVDVAASNLAVFLLHNVFTILNWGKEEWEAFANNFKEFINTAKFYDVLGEPKTEVELIEKVYTELESLVD